jgi:hypothetical protein
MGLFKGKDKEKKEKKPFNETKFGKFLDKSKDVIAKNGGNILELGIAAVTGNVGGVVNEVKDILGKDSSPESLAMLNELRVKEKEMILEFEKEMYAIEVKDRSSARTREVEIVKAGGTDFMMYVAGFVGLGLFVFIVVSVVYMPQLAENKLLIHVLGIIEGVCTSIFFYYFGSSKSSSDKNRMIDKNL